jgi:hypothetical protein
VSARVSAWAALSQELDAWAEQGRTATLWWRDDDATAVTPALERLLSISRSAATPLALAVIPRDATHELRQRLNAEPLVSVLQHGWGHVDHANGSGRADEYGPERPLAARVAELAEGRNRLLGYVRFVPAFVPPWNRMGDDLPPALPDAGLAGLSALGPRPAAFPAPRVTQVNVHVDIMNWQTRRFIGLDGALQQLVAHLHARRTGEADGTEPSGIMTHHLFHDEEAWQFIAALLAFTRTRPSVRWLAAAEAFTR